MADFYSEGVGSVASVALTASEWDQVVSAVTAARYILPEGVRKAMVSAAELARVRESVSDDGREPHDFVAELRGVVPPPDSTDPVVVLIRREHLVFLLQFSNRQLVGALVMDEEDAPALAESLKGV